MDFTIRRGEVRDMAAILELIEELAQVKKQSNSVLVTMYDLINNGFSKSELFISYVAEEGDKIAGFMLFTKSYSITGKSLRLEEVFVSARYKKKGIGISLFSKFLEYAESTKASLLEWVLQERFQNLLELYRESGAKVLDNLNVYQLNKEDVQRILLENKAAIENGVDGVVVRKGEMRDMTNVLELIEELCKEKDIPCDIDIYDLMKDGFAKKTYFKTIVAEVNEEIIGMILFYDSFSTLKGKSSVIEELYVKPMYRDKRVGKLLSNSFFEYTDKNKINRIIQVVSSEDKLTISRNVFFGAKKIKDLKVIRMTKGDLDKFVNSKA